MKTAFEKLSDHEPPEYQAWRKMRAVPLESLRRRLMRARTGFDAALGSPFGI